MLRCGAAPRAPSATRSVPSRRYTTPARPQRVGFIGLGNMGARMAANLQKAGHRLVVNDVSVNAAKDLVAKGAKFVESPREAAQDVDAVITMLPSSPHVKEIAAANAYRGAKSGTLLIDASTIDPSAAQEVAAKANEKGSVLIDCPVSGGVLGAENATLTFMVGGSPADVERAKPLLSNMGKNIVHCGAVGTGQIAKICNNLVLAISMIGVSEAMNLGVTLGIDPKVLAGIFNTSSARCWSSEVYNPVPGVLPNVPASRGYTGGFGSALMAKDVGLAVAAAHAKQVPLPLGGVALQVYNLIGAHGHAQRDFSVVYEFLANKGKK